MPASTPFDHYLLALRKTAVDQKTEHTDRAALEGLLQALAQGAGGGFAIQHEPKRDIARGAPDFKVARKGLIIGYVETKKIGDNLDKVLKSEQIAKYKALSTNIVLTDYLHFIWISPSGVQRESLCHETDLESRKFRLRADRVDAVQKLLKGFFSTAPEGIGQASQLAIALATRARMLRDFLFMELTRQQKQHAEGRLFGLFQVFQKQVFQELTLQEFADAFAQMLAYGLFLARLNSENSAVTLRNARDFVPTSFQLIRELVDFLSVLEQKEYSQVRWVVEEVLSIVNSLDLLAIHEDLSFRHRKATSKKLRAMNEEEHRLFERDPFIYFYEDFLNHYDKDTRKSRGVYYTPPPIVSFIVRAVDDILKDSFGIKDGLADHQRVTVLDFACGTGTFLLEVFQRIFENIGGANAGIADLIVREHLLKNIYGFEYLIAPYTIAHLKLSQYLREQQLPLKDGERLKVYLTNTLEPMEPQKDLLMPAVTAEAEAAHAIKEQPILVIIGNPPYSGHSKNKGKWITSQIGKYREGFPELSRQGQGKWLQDDYVKFIRFAQLKMDGGNFEFSDEKGHPQTVRISGAEEGVVAIITNHSFLDNPTFKGMRRSLLASFNRIHVLDLHGNSNKKEISPDGSRDQNVFDIKQGVAVTLLIKNKKLEKQFLHCDIWGDRIKKYRATAATAPKDISWRELTPVAPNYLFKPVTSTDEEVFNSFVSIPQIFAPSGAPAPGFVTTQDKFAISFSKQEMEQKITRFVEIGTEREARQLWKLCSQSQWVYNDAVKKLRELQGNLPLVEVLYQPFDRRWTVWDRHVSVHLRDRIHKHMWLPNFSINLIRKMDIVGQWSHVLISDRPISHHAVSSKEVNFIFPLFLYQDETRQENISAEFRSFLDERYAHHYAPEEILAYIYSVLYSPTYRNRYADFLRIDFPRIPFADSREDFDALSLLGWELIEAHLLRNVPSRGLGKFTGKGDREVVAVTYGEVEQKVHINKDQSFGPVPEDVWRFTIGGYQVLDKYLKSRKGRSLCLDEIKHVAKVADCLSFTIDQMKRIDEAWCRAFPEQN